MRVCPEGPRWRLAFHAGTGNTPAFMSQIPFPIVLGSEKARGGCESSGPEHEPNRQDPDLCSLNLFQHFKRKVGVSVRKLLCGLAVLGVMGLVLVVGQPQAAQAGQASEAAPVVQSGDVEYGWVYDSSWYAYGYALARARWWNDRGYYTLTRDDGNMYHVYVWF
jgi:hypothetical protein